MRQLLPLMLLNPQKIIPTRSSREFSGKNTKYVCIKPIFGGFYASDMRITLNLLIRRRRTFKNSQQTVTSLNRCPTPATRAYMNSQVHSRKRRWHKRRGQNQEFVPAEFVRRLHWGERLARRDIKTLVMKSWRIWKRRKKEWSIINAPPNDRRVRTENRGGESKREGGRRRGEGMRCLYKAHVCKILAEMKAGSPVDCFLIEECDRSSCSKVSKLYAQTPFPNPGAKPPAFRLKTPK